MPVSQTPPTLIVACHAWFHELTGGAFKLATEFAESVAERGFRVCYVCGTSDPHITNPTVSHNVELWRYPFPRKPSPHPGNLWGHVWETRRLVKEIATSSPIAAISGHSPLQFWGATLGVPASVRTVYTVHSPFAAELKAHWQHEPLTWKRRITLGIAEFVERRLYQRANLVHGLSEFTVSQMQPYLSRSSPQKTTVEPGWIDPGRFHTGKDRHSLRSELGAPWQPNEQTFFTLRRLEPRMGLEPLLHAAAMLKANGKNFQLIIGGGGSLRPRLEQLKSELQLEGIVHFLGRVSDDDLPKCFAAADCFVLPSQALECFGIIILEAYAAGTPVIGTKVAAIPELIRPVDENWLAQEPTAASISSKMVAFLQGELKAEADQLRNIANRYRREEIVDRWLKLCLPSWEGLR